MAEIEISIVGRACPTHPGSGLPAPRERTAALEGERNARRYAFTRPCTAREARATLHDLYPAVHTNSG